MLHCRFNVDITLTINITINIKRQRFA